jgi:hypothetical protein
MIRPIKRTTTPKKTPKPVKMTEAAPNRWVQQDLAISEPPAEVVFCDVVASGDGTCRLVPRSWEKLVRLTPQLSLQLGLGRSTLTLRRLIQSGFVDGARVAPFVYTLNLSSYFSHLKRCAENLDFWNDPKVRDQYRKPMS